MNDQEVVRKAEARTDEVRNRFESRTNRFRRKAMATHMQAVETTWTFKYEHNNNRVQESDPNKIPAFLRMLKEKSDVKFVEITETRTCDALPGMRYTQTHIVDLDKYYPE